MNVLIILVLCHSLSRRIDIHTKWLELHADTILKLMDLEKEP